MNTDELLNLIEQITVWRRGDQRAPHKPLLVLYALGRCSRDEPRMIPFSEVACALGELLIEFGPPRKSVHPEYPFWRLQNDGLWVVEATRALTPRRGSTDPLKSELLEVNAVGGFILPIYDALHGDKHLRGEVAFRLLQHHFPASMHEEILNAVGLDVGTGTSVPSRRDPGLRALVIRAYEHRCAVCGFNLRLANSDVALDAAHIKWHQAGGPDKVCNGLALCAMHHRLFDRGAFTLITDYRLLVSQQIHGTQGLGEWLLRYHGQSLLPPQQPQDTPHPQFVDWHQREVFKVPARHLVAEDR